MSKYPTQVVSEMTKAETLHGGLSCTQETAKNQFGSSAEINLCLIRPSLVPKIFAKEQ
jgi:hypothetical protein